MMEVISMWSNAWLFAKFHNNQVDRAQETIAQLLDADGNVEDVEALFYLGEMAMHQNDFIQAAKYFKQCLKENRISKDRKTILHKLKNCEAGLDIVHLPKIGFVGKSGANSKFD